MSSINNNQFAQMFKEVFGTSKITRAEANSKGLDTSEIDGSVIDINDAYADKDIQEYVIAQYNANMDELDEIPEEEDDIKPATGEGTQADV